MNSQIKLSLWDAFSYYLSGCALLLCAAVHIAGSNVEFRITWDKVPATLLGLCVFVLPLLAGLLLEPLANGVGDLLLLALRAVRQGLEKWTGGRIQSSKSQQCRRTVQQLAEESMPDRVVGVVSSYHWCKDYLLQEGVATPYMAFLGKFGFYRNMSLLFVGNCVAVLLLYGWHLRGFLLMFFLLLLSGVFAWRSAKFYEHMGKAVFGHYLVFKERGRVAEEPSGDDG